MPAKSSLLGTADLVAALNGTRTWSRAFVLRMPVASIPSAAALEEYTVEQPDKSNTCLSLIHI